MQNLLSRYCCQLTHRKKLFLWWWFPSELCWSRSRHYSCKLWNLRFCLDSGPAGAKFSWAGEANTLLLYSMIYESWPSAHRQQKEQGTYSQTSSTTSTGGSGSQLFKYVPTGAGKATLIFTYRWLWYCLRWSRHHSSRRDARRRSKRRKTLSSPLPPLLQTSPPRVIPVGRQAGSTGAATATLKVTFNVRKDAPPPPSPSMLSIANTVTNSAESVAVSTLPCREGLPGLPANVPPSLDHRRPSRSRRWKWPLSAAATATCSGCRAAPHRPFFSRWPPLEPPLGCRAAMFDGEASQAVAGTYTPPALGPGKVGGIGSQLFSYTPIAPGTASITFAYKLDPPPTLSLVCAVSCWRFGVFVSGRSMTGSRASAPVVATVEVTIRPWNVPSWALPAQSSHAGSISNSRRGAAVSRGRGSVRGREFVSICPVAVCDLCVADLLVRVVLVWGPPCGRAAAVWRPLFHSWSSTIPYPINLHPLYRSRVRTRYKVWRPFLDHSWCDEELDTALNDLSLSG